MPTTDKPNKLPSDGLETGGSWFGGPALTDGPWPDDNDTTRPDLPPGDDSPAWPSSSGQEEEQASHTTFFRIYRAFLTARAALGLTLVGVLLGSLYFGNKPTWWMLSLTLVYSGITVIWWGLPSQRRPRKGNQQTLRTRQAIATVGADLSAFALLHLLAGTSFNSQALLILPVLMAGWRN